MPLPAIAPWLAARDRQPEQMDAPDLPRAAHEAALRGLARLNRLSRTASNVWPHLLRLARAAPGRPLRVHDVATGGGDVSIRLAEWAKRAGVAVEISASDRSEQALELARAAAARAGAAVGFVRHDILHSPLPETYDLVTSSLFLHHLDDGESLTLLTHMAKAASGGFVIDDLARGRLSYVAVWCVTRLVSSSPIVSHDGQLSVRAAYTPAEVLELCARANLTRVHLTRPNPCRFVLTWSRS